MYLRLHWAALGKLLSTQQSSPTLPKEEVVDGPNKSGCELEHMAEILSFHFKEQEGACLRKVEHIYSNLFQIYVLTKKVAYYKRSL